LIDVWMTSQRIKSTLPTNQRLFGMDDLTRLGIYHAITN